MRPMLEDVVEVEGLEEVAVVEAGLVQEGKIQGLVQVLDPVGSAGEARKRILILHPPTPNNNMETLGTLEKLVEVQVIQNKIMEQGRAQALESKTGMFLHNLGL